MYTIKVQTKHGEFTLSVPSESNHQAKINHQVKLKPKTTKVTFRPSSHPKRM